MYFPVWPDPIPDLPAAACKGAPLELFVITSRSGVPAALSYDNKEGLDMCSRCPERVPCSRLPLDRDGIIFGGVAYGPRKPRGDLTVLATAPGVKSPGAAA